MSTNPVIEVLATEELTDAQKASIIDVCNDAHDTDAFLGLFTTFIPSGGRHFLAYRGSDLVSHAVVTERWAQPDDQDALRTAYVDAVSTRPAWQGRGFGTATMRTLAEHIDDYEIGCLQTDRAGFYERLGWELWRGPLSGRDDDGTTVPTPGQTGVMVLRLAGTSEVDLDSGLSIERQPSRFWE